MLAPLTPATLEATVALCERVFPWNQPEAAEALRASLAPHRHPAELLDRAAFDRTCWVATLEGAVAGTINLYRKLDDWREALHLGWFAVAPEARRRGIGTTLLRHAVTEAEASGVPFLRLETSDSGDERFAQPLYEAFGFAVVRTRQDSWGSRARWTTIWREKRLHPGLAPPVNQPA
jgi:ribosomal protein S18 acetylase RimI-like enzyme